MDSNYVERLEQVARPFEQKLIEDTKHVTDVDSDGNEYTVQFDSAATWDRITEVFHVALRNFQVVTEYETLGSDGVRYTIEDSSAIKVGE